MPSALPVPYPPAQRTGEPVPAEATCYMERVHSATPGVWNGIPVTLDDMKAMADNFCEFSTGDEPYYRPYIVVNHDDQLGAGLVTKADFDGRELHLDGDHIPESVGSLANGKRLHSASIEFWEPKYDDAGNLVGTFMRPDGTYSPTPVIKSLSLLGNDAPGMKGMAALPTARFSDKFRRLNPALTKGVCMNHDDLVNALVAQGFPADALVDLDRLLQFLVDQKVTITSADTNNTPDPAEAVNTAAPVAMADMTRQYADLAAPMSVPSISGGGGPQAPTSLTLKFNDASGKPQTLVIPGAQLKGLIAPELRTLAAVTNQFAGIQQRAKDDAIRAFGDRLAAANVPPVRVAALKKTLSALDHTQTRKFSDGKTVGTQLAEAMRDLEAAEIPTPTKKPGEEHIRQPMPTGKDGTTGAGAQQTSAFADRKAAMLANDPTFSAAMKRQTKAAGTK